ncbi:winged helix-turn-helix transcriptional regulator [Plantactinospora sp. S1510]|uniref:Winged helix-turn-helix transcriptional regulator n=1 Tax=Plantactinospora alkalitolerans TaxID=2789879 RepID=A0ABS0H2F2_9ACTN|nr:winged helix-turn-helix domain-containing protein [Plantactinospora alkalitolerans]MBF9132625.1 winged helix-turn-helix transcriptional regulator [Plantactinospora alkalitolerans]
MSIDRRSHTPVYRQLANLIREGIYAGQYVAGAPLPSEVTLSQEYGVGRDAVRQALALLRSEGLVSTERGERSRVRVPPERVSVELPPGGRAVARMPADPERVERDMDEGVPVIEVHHPDGTTEVHPGDKTELIRPA